MQLPNGAQMHEINKFIGTATTLVVAGVIIYSNFQEEKTRRIDRKRRATVTSIDAALDARDRRKFNQIIKDGYTPRNHHPFLP